jgi:hypothetical protein
MSKIDSAINNIDMKYCGERNVFDEICTRFLNEGKGEYRQALSSQNMPPPPRIPIAVPLLDFKRPATSGPTSPPVATTAYSLPGDFATLNFKESTASPSLAEQPPSFEDMLGPDGNVLDQFREKESWTLERWEKAAIEKPTLFVAGAWWSWPNEESNDSIPLPKDHYPIADNIIIDALEATKKGEKPSVDDVSLLVGFLGSADKSATRERVEASLISQANDLAVFLDTQNLTKRGKGKEVEQALPTTIEDGRPSKVESTKKKKRKGKKTSSSLTPENISGLLNAIDIWPLGYQIAINILKKNVTKIDKIIDKPQDFINLSHMNSHGNTFQEKYSKKKETENIIQNLAIHLKRTSLELNQFLEKIDTFSKSQKELSILIQKRLSSELYVLLSSISSDRLGKLIKIAGEQIGKDYGPISETMLKDFTNKNESKTPVDLSKDRNILTALVEDYIRISKEFKSDGAKDNLTFSDFAAAFRNTYD